MNAIITANDVPKTLHCCNANMQALVAEALEKLVQHGIVLWLRSACNTEFRDHVRHCEEVLLQVGHRKKSEKVIERASPTPATQFRVWMGDSE